MRDKTLGMIVATAIAAPVVVFCCGGGLVLIGSALAGLAGWLSGSGVLMSALIALIAGSLALSFRRWSGKRSAMNHRAHAGEHGS